MVSKRIVLDIGHGSDTYPPSKGIGSFAEHSFNSAVGIAAKALAEYNGFTVLLPQLPNSKEIPLKQRSAWINAEHHKSPILCLLSIHANAGPGNPSGHDVFYWHTSANGKRLAEIWQRHAKAVLPIPAHGIWESKPGSFSFHIIRETLPPAILAEHFYFTNPVELARCNTSAYVDLCAKVAVQAICEYAGVAYKEPAPSGGEGKVYRVQVGAFADEANAERLAADLRQKGYSTMIV
jgi:N-acetylmuramoyl-L-alanine amidase